MLLLRLIGIVPLGIGLTVLGFVWSPPYSAFGAVPVFGRIFASFIALGFLLIGGAFLAGANRVLPRQLQQLQQLSRRAGPLQEGDSTGQASGAVGYRCTRCGAPLDESADVSPHGDVKCAHCDRWFNIHSSSTG